ncbi:hypothetical protein B0H15DRAFT_863289 [Mycena belliarum]|uniref:Uncharacterized protein n=1 Tax=Mycena belliarum TaxID=1033014 RepID=A0AAD6XIE0_9AGAR|nr:hypothetical protein B0H15DRAFT_863289 [Mycena belliae]
MMHLSLVLASTFLAVAVPALGAPSQPMPQANFGTIPSFYACSNWNWGPPCFLVEFPLNTCQNFADDFQNSLSSFGPAVGYTCSLYTGLNCQDANPQIVWYPGANKVADNDLVKSYNCSKSSPEEFDPVVSVTAAVTIASIPATSAAAPAASVTKTTGTTTTSAAAKTS